jgi:hypothetical protein
MGLTRLEAAPAGDLEAFSPRRHRTAQAHEGDRLRARSLRGAAAKPAPEGLCGLLSIMPIMIANLINLMSRRCLLANNAASSELTAQRSRVSLRIGASSQLRFSTT